MLDRYEWTDPYTCDVTADGGIATRRAISTTADLGDGRTLIFRADAIAGDRTPALRWIIVDPATTTTGTPATDPTAVEDYVTRGEWPVGRYPDLGVDIAPGTHPDEAPDACAWLALQALTGVGLAPSLAVDSVVYVSRGAHDAALRSYLEARDVVSRGGDGSVADVLDILRGAALVAIQDANAIDRQSILHAMGHVRNEDRRRADASLRALWGAVLMAHMRGVAASTCATWAATSRRTIDTAVALGRR